MSPSELQFPVAYYDRVAYHFAPDSRYSPTYFGGPSDYIPVGNLARRARLHHVMTLAGAIIPALDRNFVFTLPLFYGIRHDGCRLTYPMPSQYRFELTSLTPPKPTKDWPYPNYPPFLPYVPFCLRRKTRCSPKQFLGWTHQGLELRAKTLVVVVPPIFVGGVSMWGPGGDAEGVQLVFQ
jgi:hypothetical protein